MRRIFIRAALFLCVLVLPAAALAQGCSLCRDATAGSSPGIRLGLRRGILALGIPAVAVFVGILAVARKIEPGEPRS